MDLWEVRPPWGSRSFKVSLWRADHVPGPHFTVSQCLLDGMSEQFYPEPLYAMSCLDIKASKQRGQLTVEWLWNLKQNLVYPLLWWLFEESHYLSRQPENSNPDICGGWTPVSLSDRLGFVTHPYRLPVMWPSERQPHGTKTIASVTQHAVELISSLSSVQYKPLSRCVIWSEILIFFLFVPQFLPWKLRRIPTHIQTLWGLSHTWTSSLSSSAPWRGFLIERERLLVTSVTTQTIVRVPSSEPPQKNKHWSMRWHRWEMGQLE